MNVLSAYLKKHAAMLAAAMSLAFCAMASAQEMDHSKMHMPMTMPMPAKPAPAKKPAAKPPRTAAAATTPKRSAPAHAVKRTETATTLIDDGSMPGMDHSTMDHAVMDHDDMTMPMPMDHDAMPGMNHSQTPAEATPSKAAEKPPSIPAPTDADRAAAFPQIVHHAMNDDGIHSYTLFNRFEAWNADHGSGLTWEGQAWIGTDLDKLWLRSEGERSDGITDVADLEVLYGRSKSRWWDVLAGLRHDFRPGTSQDWLAFGVQGVAPYKIEVRATAYLGSSGRTAARIETEYELLLSNRLILQPMIELNFAGRQDARRGIGSGLSTAEFGLRLRYEITRQFAPYIGIVRERAFAGTADFRRAAGNDSNDTRFVVGLRFWF